MNFRVVRESPGPPRLGEVTIGNAAMFRTPIFMPVATQASVKALGGDDLKSAGSKMLLANTYHLTLRPGLQVIQSAGGLHRFMNWDGGLLTDSGGFQVMSLAHLSRVHEEGVIFKSHIDGRPQKFTPENVIDAQLAFGVDAMTCLDVCLSYPSPSDQIREALEQTLRWSKRAMEQYKKSCGLRVAQPATRNPQLLFGILQGGFDENMRREAVGRMKEMGFNAFALGGLSVGEPKELTWAMTKATCQELAGVDAPRYLMGVGDPLDFWEACSCGIDLMDCVLPTRNARNGQALTSRGKIYVKNSAFRQDQGPLDPDCNCLTCRRYSRSYLCHLYHAGELLLHRLLSLHNVAFMMRLTGMIQQAIAEDRFDAAYREFRNNYGD